MTRVRLGDIKAGPVIADDDGEAPARSRDVDRRVRISVRDYGCGIPADVLPRIFDPYFTTKPGGSGLAFTGTLALWSAVRVAITSFS